MERFFTVHFTNDEGEEFIDSFTAGAGLTDEELESLAMDLVPSGYYYLAYGIKAGKH